MIRSSRHMEETNKTIVDFLENSSSSDALQLKGFINNLLDVNEPLSLESGRRPLHIAASKGNVGMVQELLICGAFVDVLDYLGNTPLLYASREGHLEVVRLLLHQKADPNSINDKGCTILQNAVCFEHLEITRLLLLKGANLYAETSHDSLPPRLQSSKWYSKDKTTVLTFAFELENLPIINELVTAEVDVNKESHLLLGVAIEKHNIELMTLLLEKGVDVERKCADGHTPLNAAIRYGCLGIVEMLLNRGAKIEKVTSLLLAFRNGHLDIAKLLIIKGAKLSFELMDSALEHVLLEGHNNVAEWLFERSLNYMMDLQVPDKCYADCFRNAIYKRNIEMARIVVNRIKDLDTRICHHGVMLTLLILSTKYKWIPVIELLLESGADMTVCDPLGNSVLYYAVVDNDDPNIFEIFLRKGATVNDVVTKGRQTALHLVIKDSNISLIKYLLSKGADFNAKDNFGNTPLNELFKLGLFRLYFSTCIVKPLVGKEPFLMRDPDDYLQVLFLEKYCNVNKDTLTHVKDKIQDSITKGHISLVKVIFKKLVEFYFWETVVTANESNTITTNEMGPVSSLDNVEEKDSVTDLHRAAYVGNINRASIALDSGANIDAVMKGRLTPLQIALYRGYTEMATHLINEGANVVIKDDLSFLPIHLAFLLGDVTLIKQLYSRKPVNDPWMLEIPFLHLAAYHGDTALIAFLLSKGFNLNTRDIKNNTILHIAVNILNSRLVEFLLEKRIEKNVHNSSGNTAFYIAVELLSRYEFTESSPSFEICQHLLRHEVDIDLVYFGSETALHRAASTPLAEFLLRKGVSDVNAKNRHDFTPLHNLAAHFCNRKNFSFEPTNQVIGFLKHGADISFRNKDGVYVIHSLLRHEVVDQQSIYEECDVEFASNVFNIFRGISVRMKNEELNMTRKFNLMRTLLRNGFTLNTSNDEYNHPLIHSTKEKQFYPFKFLLQKDKRIYLNVVLSQAIKESNFNIIKPILDKVDVNTSEGYEVNMFFPEQGQNNGLAQIYLDRVKVSSTLESCVPLVLVAKTGKCAAVKTILDKGAYVNSVDEQGNTALNYAVASGNLELCHLLINRRAEITLTNKRNEKPVDIAVKSSNANILKLLIDRGSTVSTKDVDDNTFLHKARYREVAEVLINLGVRVNALNSSKRTALHCLTDTVSDVDGFRLSETINVPETAAFLIEKGAIVNAKDDSGMTPLHLAAQNNYSSTVQVLVYNGASMDLKDNNGQTALYHAVSNTRIEIVEFLLAEGAFAYLIDAKDNVKRTPYSRCRFESRPDSQLLIDKYLLKEKLANLSSGERENGHATLSGQEEASCIEELGRIKLTKVCGTYNLLELIAKFQKPTGYLLDESLVESSIATFLSSNLLNQFPNYKGILRSAFRRSWGFLIRQAINSMYCVTRRTFCKSLPVEVWLYVLSFLSIDELQNIVESGTTTFVPNWETVGR